VLSVPLFTGPIRDPEGKGAKHHSARLSPSAISGPVDASHPHTTGRFSIPDDAQLRSPGLAPSSRAELRAELRRARRCEARGPELDPELQPVVKPEGPGDDVIGYCAHLPFTQRLIGAISG
jgi:hypothetical protein